MSWNGGHNNWAEDMKLPAMVEQTVHMIAAHEARRRFPLDSTRIDADYPDNTVEIWYPGVHSDVGGGYAPQEQGRENTISRFALNHMYEVAFAAGVLFEKMKALPPEVQDEFNKDDAQLREAFNAYIDAVPKKTGSMEEVLASHMQVMHRWLKERVAGKGESASTVRLVQMRDEAKKKAKAARKQQAAILTEGQGSDGGEIPVWSSEQEQRFQAATKERKAADKDYDEASDALNDLKQEERKYLWDVQDIYFRETQGQKLSLRERSIKDAWEDTSPLPEAVKRFFDLFSHDSVAHFNFDTSRLSDWRTVYFGDSKFKPN